MKQGAIVSHMSHDATGGTMTDSTHTVYMQATTQVLHARKNCGITARTRYNHFEREMTDAQISQCQKCKKCWSS